MIQRLEVRSDDIEAVVLPGCGARLHRLRAFGRDLLRTPDDPVVHWDDPFFWGAYPMAPWCNRVPPGKHVIDGRTVVLTPNFVDGTAIHGQLFRAPWTVVEDTRLTVSAGGDGWPWTYDVTLDLAVGADRLELAYRLDNTSDAAMPAGLGLHPWFRKPVRLTVPARRVFPVNADPPPWPEPVAGAFDLREPGPLADDLDATWTDLDERAVVLSWPDVSARMEFSASAGFVVAASPAQLDAVAVEPQTHAPDGLARLAGGLPGGLTVLAPGESLELRVSWTVTRADG